MKCSRGRLGILFILSLFSFSALAFLGSCKPKPVTEDNHCNPLNSEKNAPSATLRKVIFLPYWVSNAQFAGYYMAKDMSVYRKYGLEVQILPYEPFYTTSEIIQDGKVDFAALWLLNAIEIKASGVDLVNIAQFSTRSSLMLVTKKSSGIAKLSDMNHKKAGIWSGYELQPKTLFKKYNLNVEIIPIGSTNNLFLEDGVDITNANWFDEYHSIINSGYDPDELNTFFFADYGLNFLEDGLYCLAEKMKNEPQLCADFVKATMEGWILAFNNPEEALNLVISYVQSAKLPVNRSHQRWMLNRYRDLYLHGDTVSTVLAEKDYRFAGQVLLESGLISKIPPFTDFFLPYNKVVQ